MSKTSKYFYDTREDFSADGLDYTLCTTYAVFFEWFVDPEHGHSNDDWSLVSYPTLEQAEAAFTEAYRLVYSVVNDVALSRANPHSILRNSTAFGRVALCANLDVMMRPSGSFTTAELAWSGDTHDWAQHFETDMEDLTSSFTRSCLISTDNYSHDKEVIVEWAVGEIEIPEE